MANISKLNEAQSLRIAARGARWEASRLSSKFDGRCKSAMMARARRFEQKAARLEKEAYDQGSRS
jgi:hypothetical protein